MQFNQDKSRRPRAGTAILTAWLVAGTMDITAASIQYYIRTGKGPAPVLRFIASGIFGKPALTGGTKMEVLGLIFHYCIALLFTLFFFWIYPLLPALKKNRVVTGLVYGMLVWFIMNRIVLPLSNAPAIPFVLKKAAIAMAILMVCIGLPISLIIGRYYQQKP